MPRPDQRPDDRQRASVRDELHAQVDAVCAGWAAIDRQAAEMGRGFPSGGDGASEAGSVVERAALSDAFDPSAAALEWQALFTEARGQLRTLEARTRRLLPSNPDDLARAEVARANRNLKTCALCGVVSDQTRRHKESDYCKSPCYYQVWKSGREAAS